MAIEKKIPQLENGDIYVAEGRIFVYQVFFIYLAYIFSQVCLILLHLLTVWLSDAASKSMLDFH